MTKMTKRTNIGVSESIVAYMVKIDWTSAKVVKVSAKQSFKMTCYRVSVLRGEYKILSQLQLTVSSDQVFYFTASDGLSGYYYIVQDTGTQLSCTCPRGKIHQPCHHIDEVIEFMDPAAYADVA